jgi:hypothetical protein
LLVAFLRRREFSEGDERGVIVVWPDLYLIIAAPIILRRWFFSFEKPVELDASAQEFAPSNARCLPSSPYQLLAGVAHGVASSEDDLGQVEPQGLGCRMVYRRETQRLRASGPQQAVDLYVHRWQRQLAGTLGEGASHPIPLLGLPLTQAKRESLALGQGFPPFCTPVFPLVFARFR